MMKVRRANHEEQDNNENSSFDDFIEIGGGGDDEPDEPPSFGAIGDSLTPFSSNFSNPDEEDGDTVHPSNQRTIQPISL